MTAESELADFVNDQMRGTPVDAALGAMISGLADIVHALGDAQAQRGNWGGMIAKLRAGAENARLALGPLRAEGPAFAGLVKHAERQISFASVVVDEIIRLQQGEST